MEEARVVIVGAGPAGLVLSLALAKHGIQVCILIRANV
jgi:flavin-dependent dehydrogenase